MAESLRDRLAGRWAEILPQLGIATKYLTNRNTSCPLCGGRDRFRFTPSKGLYVCNKCGGGDGITLAMKVNGWDFKATADKIESLMGALKATKPRPVSDFDTYGAMNSLWRLSQPITLNTPAGKYLTKRTGLTEFPSCLRAVDSLRYWDGETASFHPAMIAKVSGPKGGGVNVYRMYLTKDGDKARVDQPRRMMSGTVPLGSAVRLFQIIGDVLGIAEGIETSIAASIMFCVPVWALLGTGGMKTWVPPDRINKVIVFGDCDENYAGQAAAYSLGERLLCLSKRRLEVEVRIPGHETAKIDWDDVFRSANREVFQQQR
jgi:putative DNA primase/helicase